MSQITIEKLPDILARSSCFRKKTDGLKQLICETLEMLGILGIPFNHSPRRLERMALAFLAVINKKVNNQWRDIKDLSDSVSLKTREIIEILNADYEESISSGSYDDIRRKDIQLLVLGQIIIPSAPDSAKNSPNRGYALNPVYTEILKKSDFLSKENWKTEVSRSLKNTQSVKAMLSEARDIQQIPVKLSSGHKLLFSPGIHNQLQKAIIEEFLPRYGYGCEVLYVGDTADKFLYINEAKLKELKFFKLLHDELPDILAYSEHKNWLYLIEAVHSSGPINDVRLVQLRRLTTNCKAAIIFVTAFLNKETFQKFIKDIAWETEIWIAESPDHIIHFDGEKFLGPYQEKTVK